MAQCEQIVYVRDTYRYTGRGKNDGFEMHYIRRRCQRLAHNGTYCWQHAVMHEHDDQPDTPAPPPK